MLWADGIGLPLHVIRHIVLQWYNKKDLFQQSRPVLFVKVRGKSLGLFLFFRNHHGFLNVILFRSNKALMLL